MDEKRALLRHTIATLAYRAACALNGAPEAFGEFNGTGRTPAQILAHMGDLFDWALSMVQGHQRWNASTPLPWAAEKERFFRALTAFDTALAEPGASSGELEQLFQGPIADALTHVGQLAMQRRLAGCPIHGENFYVADITAGRVGMDQAAPVQAF